MRRASIIASIALAAVLLAAGAGLAAFDRAQRDVLVEGVRIGGVDVGGLDRQEAVTRLRERLVARLREPLRVDHGTRSWVLGPREARISVNVTASVDQALDHSRADNVVVRAWRAVTGARKPVDLQPEVRWSPQAVVRMLDRIRSEVGRAPRSAKVELEPRGPRLVKPRTGLEVRASELHRQLRAAITSATAERRLVARTRKVAPRTTMAEVRRRYQTVLIANRSTFQLALYTGLKKVKTYGIATGQAEYPTPGGLFSISNKQVDPVWSVPNSPWAGELQGTTVAGGTAANPLKARWMGIVDGVGIHGTSAEGSIGSAASHGCLRMRVADVIDLYPRVPVGTPILIA